MSRQTFSVDEWLSTYFDPRDDEIRDFWMKSLYDQIHWTPRELRSRCRWRMNLRTFNLLRTLERPRGGYIIPLPPMLAGAPEALLNFPIDLDDAAEGAVLYVAECP